MLYGHTTGMLHIMGTGPCHSENPWGNFIIIIIIFFFGGGDFYKNPYTYLNFRLTIYDVM